VTASNGQREGRRQVPGAAVNYVQALGGIVSCRRCSALLLDTQPARNQHDQFHAALRTMYERIGARP
jgi:hypothetical protein